MTIQVYDGFCFHQYAAHCMKTKQYLRQPLLCVLLNSLYVSEDFNGFEMLRAEKINLHFMCLMPRRIIFLSDQVPWLKLLKTEMLYLCSISFVFWVYEIFFVSGSIFSTSPPAFFCCIPHDVSNSAHLLTASSNHRQLFYTTLSCRIQTPGWLLGLVMEFPPLFFTQP